MLIINTFRNKIIAGTSTGWRRRFHGDEDSVWHDQRSVKQQQSQTAWTVHTSVQAGHRAHETGTFATASAEVRWPSAVATQTTATATRQHRSGPRRSQMASTSSHGSPANCRQRKALQKSKQRYADVPLFSCGSTSPSKKDGPLLMEQEIN